MDIDNNVKNKTLKKAVVNGYEIEKAEENKENVLQEEISDKA